MQKIKVEMYDAHKDYKTKLDLDLMNTKIKIYNEEKGADALYFEGTVGKFVKERIPSDQIVELLPRLKTEERIEYKLKTEVVIIEKQK